MTHRDLETRLCAQSLFICRCIRRREQSCLDQDTLRPCTCAEIHVLRFVRFQAETLSGESEIRMKMMRMGIRRDQEVMVYVENLEKVMILLVIRAQLVPSYCGRSISMVAACNLRRCDTFTHTPYMTNNESLELDTLHELLLDTRTRVEASREINKSTLFPHSFY